METITHKGKVYQVGKCYMDEGGHIGVLKGTNGLTLSMKSQELGLWYCDNLNLITAGTIEDAPIELEDGEWYMCEKFYMDQRCEVPYYYCNGFNTGSNSKLWSPVSNYGKPLYKMVKAEG